MANPQDPNNPLYANQAPVLEPTSALNFTDLVTEVAYKIGCAYYGSSGTTAPQAPVDAHDLAICQNIVNKAVRKFINDGPKPNGWRWLNPIAQVDLWPQISYDPTGSTYVVLTYNPTIGSTTYTGCTLLTLVTPNAPPVTGNIDTSYIPRFLQSMELRQIFLNGNPPPVTPGFWLPTDENFTGPLIGNPFTILFWVSDTQVVVDGNATLPVVAAGVSSSYPYWYGPDNQIPPEGAPPYLLPGTGYVSVSPWASGGYYTLTISRAGYAQETTANIAYNASASTIATALDNLSAVGSGNATVSPAYTNATPPVLIPGLFTVVFNSSLGPVQMTLGTNSTTGAQATAPFSFAQQGDYTLPANFGGEYTGGITYVANTNRGMILHWTSEFSIRSRRQNYNIESGTPYEAAVRLMPTPSYQQLTNTSGLMLPRRRWELMTWRISSEFLSVIFPYTLAFNSLVNPTDVPPSPFTHDEALKACCLAVAEKETMDTLQGTDWAYYHEIALPQSHMVDLRSAPRALGYFGNPTAQAASAGQAIKQFRAWDYQRPTVPVFPGPT